MAGVNEGRVSKKKVLEVAKKYGREHEMCNVLKEAVAELGVEWTEDTVEFTIKVGRDVLDEFDSEDPVCALREVLSDRDYRNGGGWVIPDHAIQHKTIPAAS